MRTLATTLVIDVRELTGPNQCETVLAAFDALSAGEGVEVVSDHAPRRLLDRLQAERRGQFEWAPLEAGPERFRTEISRRTDVAGTLRGVNEALAWDHDRLEAIEKRAFELYAGGDGPGARAAWAEFAFGLRRHIRFEEEILFPAFEQGTGMPAEGGPTGVMRDEHRSIERIIDAIGRALGGDGSPLPLRAELYRVLGGHNQTEEEVLYPMTDRCLGAEDSDALVALIQAHA